ncbi:hypothetical protein MCEGE10_02056 [Flavobacteriaceae bacterium]
MKKILTTLLMFFCISSVFSQYNYIQDVYSAKNMNIKGKIKKITETLVYTDKNGKVDDNKKKNELVYEFDENGNLIKIISFDEDGFESYYDEFKYLNNKIRSRYVGDEDFYYSPSTITIKSKEKIKEVQSLSNGRVSEITYYTDSQKHYDFKYKYDYNSIGQITKRTYDRSNVGYSTFDTYEYNKLGDIKRKMQYDENSKLDWIKDFDYEYDNNKNWTKCTSVFYTPGEDKDLRLYDQITRIYEFY